MKMTINTTSVKQLQFPQISRFCNFLLFTILFSFSVLATRAGNTAQLVNESPISEIFISAAGNNLILSWQVDKTAFNYYEVEKSFDGKNFSTIGLVLDAPENSNTCLFKDKKTATPEGKMAWYRIKGIQKNGTILYSSSSSYRETEATAIETNTIFSPNPFTNTGSIKYLSNQVGFAEIKLQNAAGETLLSKQSVVGKGYNNIQLSGLSNLAAGVYVARLIINGTVMVNQKVVKD